MNVPAMQWLIFKGMEKALGKGRTNGFQGTVEYRLRGAKTESCWNLRIDGAGAQAHRGQAANPVLVFRTTLPVFARLAAGELNPAHAILERKLEVEGDLKTLAKFSAMFG